MSRLRRSLTAELKLEAASLVLDQGYFVSEARINRLEREKDIRKKAIMDSIEQRNNHVNDRFNAI